MKLSELAELSTVNINLLEKLDYVIKYIISDELVQAVKNNEDEISVELGELGTLIIIILNNEIKYRFKPSQSFNKIVCNSILKETNSLNKALECSITKKFKNIYRDFF